VRLPALHDLWRVGYGQVLLVKLSLVAAVLAWGGAHRFLIRPALERAAASGTVACVNVMLDAEAPAASGAQGYAI